MRKQYGFGKPMYDKDLVAERNQREKLKRDIIKNYNVNYIDAEALRRQEEEKKQQEALEIIKRLEDEKAADDAKKQEEIVQAMLDQVRLKPSGADYNAATGAYSGAYGQGAVKEEHRDQIDDILKEKERAFRQMLENEK